MNITVRGKRWRLVFEKVHGNTKPKAWGWCDIERRVITIDPRCPPRKRREIILHELLHASVWDLSEETVRDYGRDSDRILTKLGYPNESGAKDGDCEDD